MKGNFSMNSKMIVIAMAMLLSLGALANAQTTGIPADPVLVPVVMSAAEIKLATKIPRGSKVFIADMGGFESYLASALRKKEVPLLVVADREQADFEITGSAEKSKKAGWAKTIFLGDARSSESASITVINIRTAVVAFADSSNRGSANRGQRSTAEKLAKYLKKKIEDDEKH
jgi:hypothetical protein